MHNGLAAAAASLLARMSCSPGFVASSCRWDVGYVFSGTVIMNETTRDSGRETGKGTILARVQTRATTGFSPGRRFRV